MCIFLLNVLAFHVLAVHLKHMEMLINIVVYYTIFVNQDTTFSCLLGLNYNPSLAVTLRLRRSGLSWYLGNIFYHKIVTFIQPCSVFIVVVVCKMSLQ